MSQTALIFCEEREDRTVALVFRRQFTMRIVELVWIMRPRSSIFEIELLNKFRERRKMMKTIHIEDIDKLNFWTSYFGCSYP